MSSTSRLLPENLHPLANRFYRAHRTAMKARTHHQVWAIQRVDIEACLCVQPMEEGYWLTNLLVAPPLRSQGRASGLLREVREQVAGPIWLFCHPALREFYSRAGYVECEALPRSLADRLTRYRQSKELIALCNLPGQERPGQEG